MITRDFDAMERRRWTWAGFAAAAVIAATSVTLPGESQAQNHRAEPVYGYLRVQSPFTPDPVRVSVAAGGRINARELGFHPSCSGFFNPEAPQIKLNYIATTIAMQVYVSSAEDTTLIIRDPDGKWFCDDDSLAKNPAVRFATPKSGIYSIWVGSFGGGRPQAEVFVTEQ